MAQSGSTLSATAEAKLDRLLKMVEEANALMATWLSAPPSSPTSSASSTPAAAVAAATPPSTPARTATPTPTTTVTLGSIDAPTEPTAALTPMVDSDDRDDSEIRIPLSELVPSAFDDLIPDEVTQAPPLDVCPLPSPSTPVVDALYRSPDDMLATIADFVFTGVAAADQTPNGSGLTSTNSDAPLDAVQKFVIPLPYVRFNSDDVPEVLRWFISDLGATFAGSDSAHENCIQEQHVKLVVPVEEEGVSSTLPTRCLKNCLTIIHHCFSVPFSCSWDVLLCWQHRPWPPPSKLQLVSCEDELRPLPWPSFDMVERSAVTSLSVRLWKPPWYVSTPQHISRELADLVELWKCMMRPERIVVDLVRLGICLLNSEVMSASMISKLKLIHGSCSDSGVASVYILIHPTIACQPWPPAVLFVLMGSDGPLKPTPWPSFCESAAAVHVQNSSALVLVIPLTAVQTLSLRQEVSVKALNSINILPTLCYCASDGLYQLKNVISYTWLLFRFSQYASLLLHSGHCYHQPVQWKPPWISLACIFSDRPYIAYCLRIRTPAIPHLFRHPVFAKLKFLDVQDKKFFVEVMGQCLYIRYLAFEMNISDAMTYVLLLSHKQRCYRQFWKQPWTLSVCKVITWKFLARVRDLQSSGTMVAMFLELTGLKSVLQWPPPALDNIKKHVHYFDIHILCGSLFPEAIVVRMFWNHPFEGSGLLLPCIISGGELLVIGICKKHIFIKLSIWQVILSEVPVLQFATAKFPVSICSPNGVILQCSYTTLIGTVNIWQLLSVVGQLLYSGRPLYTDEEMTILQFVNHLCEGSRISEMFQFHKITSAAWDAGDMQLNHGIYMVVTLHILRA